MNKTKIILRQNKKRVSKEKITLLKNYFKKEPKVLLAFLFGSRAKGFARKVSDWDVAIYLDLEEEAEIDKTENKIWGDITDILEKEVDLVLLNETPSILASRIIREGIPLAIKDRNFFLDYLIKITEQADYFLGFFHDYYQIYQRTASLSEPDRARLEKIIIFLENEMKDFSKFESMKLEEYRDNISKKREVERWIENLMNSILDISKIILASEKKRIPDTYKKILKTMATVMGFEEEICDRIAQWVPLRNILAHEYLDIRWTKINDFLKNSKPYLEKFLIQTQKFLEG